jgi:cell division protein ZapA (FtsZ GTPase activity inhibitor)
MDTLQMDNMVSTTELRRSTKKIVADAQIKPQVILANSKAVGIIVSLNHYKKLSKLASLYEDLRDMLDVEESKKRNDFIPLEQAMKELGIDEKEL